jgi:hypothetical protein
MFSTPLQSDIHDVALLFINYLCLFCLFYAFTSQISPHGRFLQGRAKEKTDLYTQDISRSRGIRILYAYYLLYFLFLRNDTFTFVPV